MSCDETDVLFGLQTNSTSQQLKCRISDFIFVIRKVENVGNIMLMNGTFEQDVWHVL